MAFSTADNFLKHFIAVTLKSCWNFWVDESLIVIHDAISKIFYPKDVFADTCFWFNCEICIIFGNKLFLLTSDCILLSDLWWAINYSGNAAEEQRKTKIETMNVHMRGAEEAGDTVSGRLCRWCIKIERIQVDTSWDVTLSSAVSHKLHHEDDDEQGGKSTPDNCGKFRQVWAGLSHPQVSLAGNQRTIKRPKNIWLPGWQQKHWQTNVRI